MKLMLIKESGKQYDITNAVTKIEWSGSTSSASRQLSIDYINAPYDNFSLPEICTGDFLSFSPGSEEVFFGQLFGSEKSTAIGTITYVAFDMMKNMLESTGSYKFKNLTAEAIAKMVCDDAQIPIRWLHETTVVIPSMLCESMTLYDIVMAAYTKAHRITGDKYFPMIYKRGFAVYAAQWIVSGFEIDAEQNLIEASIKETMDNIVNVVKIYDEKGKQIGEEKDDKSKAKYGTFQAEYKQEKGISPTDAAKKLLKTTPEQVIRVRSTGDANCLSGYFVNVYDDTTGLCGKYWIRSDRHTWEPNGYTMELDLSFESIQGTVESTKEQEGKKQ